MSVAAAGTQDWEKHPDIVRARSEGQQVTLKVDPPKSGTTVVEGAWGPGEVKRTYTQTVTTKVTVIFKREPFFKMEVPDKEVFHANWSTYKDGSPGEKHNLRDLVEGKRVVVFTCNSPAVDGVLVDNKETAYIRSFTDSAAKIKEMGVDMIICLHTWPSWAYRVTLDGENANQIHFVNDNYKVASELALDNDRRLSDAGPTGVWGERGRLRWATFIADGNQIKKYWFGDETPALVIKWLEENKVERS